MVERVKLVKNKREQLKGKSVAAAFDDMKDDYDARALKRAHTRIEELEHEIRMIQNTNREMYKKVENEAAKKTRAEVVRLYEFRLKEAEVENTKLARSIARMGEEVACPECGAVHELNDFLKAD